MISNKYLAGLDIAKCIIVFVLIVFEIWPWCCQPVISALDKLKGKA